MSFSSFLMTYCKMCVQVTTRSSSNSVYTMFTTVLIDVTSRLNFILEKSNTAKSLLTLSNTNNMYAKAKQQNSWNANLTVTETQWRIYYGGDGRALNFSFFKNCSNFDHITMAWMAEQRLNNLWKDFNHYQSNLETKQIILNFRFWLGLSKITRSSAVAERLRDASCLSVVSFNIDTAQFLPCDAMHS